jgi:formate-dependent nitrite reductase membrane component NrfD
MSTEDRVRYASSVDPVTTDGRDVDTALAALTGEAARQEVRRADRRIEELAPEPWDRVPQTAGPEPTYYDVPMLKPSVWSIDIPIYYFLGGTAGAALTLGAAIQLVTRRGDDPLRRLSSICHWTGIIGSTAGAAFLIHDLGRPSRFLYMMRVFRPTSPMNMGTWILSGAAPTAILTGLLINRDGLAGKVGEVTGYLSGIFGAALAGYTGVLVSNSAIPVWQEARRWLPIMFMGSSAAAAASIIDLLARDARAARLATLFGAAGRITEIAACVQTERVVRPLPKVAEPLHRGGAGFLWRAATVLTAASLAVSLWPRREKTKLGGLLGIAGSLCLRVAVHYIGNSSAREPRASFQQQRQRLNAAPPE